MGSVFRLFQNKMTFFYKNPTFLPTLLQTIGTRILTHLRWKNCSLLQVLMVALCNYFFQYFLPVYFIRVMVDLRLTLCIFQALAKTHNRVYAECFSIAFLPSVLRPLRVPGTHDSPSKSVQASALILPTHVEEEDSTPWPGGCAMALGYTKELLPPELGIFCASQIGLVADGGPSTSHDSSCFELSLAGCTHNHHESNRFISLDSSSSKLYSKGNALSGFQRNQIPHVSIIRKKAVLYQ